MSTNRCRLSFCFMICTLSLVLVAQRAHAEDQSRDKHARTPHRWLVVPVLATDAQDRNTLALSTPLEDALRAEGQDVLGSPAGAALFDSNHSSEPVELNNDEMSRLLRRVGEAARHLALGELVQAQQAMEGVYALSGPARDYLNREAARARKIFDNCLIAAYLWERGNEHQRALRQMLDCSRSFPGFRPEGRAYPPELRELFDQATLRLGQMQSTTLLVQSGSRVGCGVRLNGIEVGKSPMSFSDVRSGMTRVQLECDEGSPSRIHEIELHPGSNHLLIDPEFDRAVSTRKALSLAYADDAARKAHSDADAKTVAHVLDREDVAVLWIAHDEGGEHVSLRRIVGATSQAVAELSFKTGAGYDPAALSEAVNKLLHPEILPHPLPLAAPVHAGTDAMLQAAETDTTDRAPRETKLAIAVPLAVVGAGGMVAGWVMYAERQDVRRALYPQGVTFSKLDTFHNQGTASLLVTGLGAGALTISDYFWLPSAERVPAWAWGVGAAGAAVGITGLGFALGGTHCDIFDPHVACQAFTADSQFGSTLALNALPLLGVPLTYLVRNVVRMPESHVQVSAQADRASSGIQIRGVF